MIMVGLITDGANVLTGRRHSVQQQLVGATIFSLSLFVAPIAAGTERCSQHFKGTPNSAAIL